MAPMTHVEMQRLRFSNWYEWSDRDRYPMCNFPGVYLISITRKTKLASTRPSWSDVVYIGMTNSQGGLLSRWRQFDRSIRGGRGHSGGRSIFGRHGHVDQWRKKLYVAAMGVECNVFEPTPMDYVKQGWVAFFEYLAFSRFEKAVGGHPEFNKQ